MKTIIDNLLEATELLEPVHTAANRVLELYKSQYITANDDGGRVAHAMKQLSQAVEGASKAYPRAAIAEALKNAIAVSA